MRRPIDPAGRPHSADSPRASPGGWFTSGDFLDRTFKVGIIFKGLDGVLELIGGGLVLAVATTSMNRLVITLTQHELSRDPDDVIAARVLHVVDGLSASTTRFAAAYLLVHGVAKVVLVGALLRNKLWAYPWMIAFLLAFIGYQVYRLALHFTVGLTALTIFDALVAWVTWREYRKQRART
jgi:uncharacterized membrane protein